MRGAWLCGAGYRGKYRENRAAVYSLCIPQSDMQFRDGYYRLWNDNGYFTEDAGAGKKSGCIPSRSLIKFELTGKVRCAEREGAGFSGAQFADSYYFVRVKDSSVYQVDYSQYELDMSLKGEFIRTVRGRTDICEEDKAAIIHYGIQALAGEEIIEE